MVESTFPAAPPPCPLVVVRHRPAGAARARWLRFTCPIAIFDARDPREVPALVDALDDAVAGAGRWAVGWFGYEAASGFDPDLRTHPPDRDGPAVARWWLFDAPDAAADDPAALLDAAWDAANPAPPDDALDWTPAWSAAAHAAAVTRVRAAIARGETYQVNLTFPLRAPLSAKQCATAAIARRFVRLCRAQPSGHGALLIDDDHAVVSLSPELFLRRDGDRLRARPMKGTARRRPSAAADAAAAARLRASAKERAENLMIVDMMRNDLGRVAQPGSVRVRDLFALERYATVHQMTSTVEARARRGLTLRALLEATFPCASVTGAPKRSTMAHIRALEPAPRGVYTGAIGVLAPGRATGGTSCTDVQLSVAIRTLEIDRRRRRARYGVGSGIVWDAEPAAEYAECQAKALQLRAAAPPTFALLETMRWRPHPAGLRAAAQHRARLMASARYFGFAHDDAAIARALDDALAALPPTRHRVRLTLARDGAVTVAAARMPRPAARPTWTIRLDDRPIDREDPFLHHKTTHRIVYDAARARHPDVDEVILWNADGQLTEGTRTNLLLRMAPDDWRTPAASCGLLPGAARAALLARGRVREAVLTADDLRRAEAIVLINALRGHL
ncbi:MAG: aminodeoxychorismate synthase component I, partial [Acidobacteriota bacterium]